MEREARPKIVLVRRGTRIDELISRNNTVQQARFVIESKGGNFDDYLEEHNRYYKQLARLREIIANFAIFHEVEKSFLPNFIFGPRDVVIALGQDGLVANTLKYLNGQPLVGVNPDRERYDGILLPFDVPDMRIIIPEVLSGKRRTDEVTMVRAELNDGQVMYAVNDLFIGPKSHASARYAITHMGMRERQSSSGIIISTGLGSTGWLHSLVVGAERIHSALADNVDERLSTETAFKWSEHRLAFTVREPFPGKNMNTQIVFGWLINHDQLKVESEMPENGVIFSDGIEQDFLAFNSGATVQVGIADKRGMLVV